MATIEGTEGPDDLTGFPDEDDDIFGYGGDDKLSGVSGDDRLEGGEGDDRLYGGADEDWLLGGSGDDELYGDWEVSSSAFSYDDVLWGGGGDDLLDGGNGDDIMEGGTGADTYIVDDVGDEVEEYPQVGNPAGEIDLVVASVDFSLPERVENLTLSYTLGVWGKSGTGNELDNTIIGNSFDNLLAGLGGKDRLDGGLGADTADYQDSDAPVQVNLTSGAGAGGDAEGDTLTGIENLAGSTFDDLLIGNSTFNTLDGAGGHDDLKGGGGADSLRGDSGNDDLIGGSGFDELDGGSGIDTAHYYDSASAVTIDLAAGTSSGGTAAGDTFVGVENLSGSPHDDDLFGNDDANTLAGQNGADFLKGAGGADSLNGGAGHDEIVGGPGSDTMSGGHGNDTLWVDNAGDGVEEFAGQGNDTVRATVSYALTAAAAVELLATGSEIGIAAINLTGNALAQTVRGNNGNNTLDSASGAGDSLIGNGGNDSYLIRNAGDVIFEYDGQGTDIALAAVSYALAAAARVETLQTTSHVGTGAINLTGNSFAQTIVGNDGVNTLDSRVGAADTLSGRGGNDGYLIRNVGDTIVEGAGQGTDTAFAAVSYTLGAAAQVESLNTTSHVGTGAINLTGNGFAQTITGNDGANALNGGAGNDTLNGRGGADTFVFNTALGASNIDTLAGYTAAQDSIDLENAIFAGLANGVLAGSAFLAAAGATAAANANQRIIYNTTSGALFFDADGAGGAVAVQFATLQGAPAVTAAEFVVV